MARAFLMPRSDMDKDLMDPQNMPANDPNTPPADGVVTPPADGQPVVKDWEAEARKWQHFSKKHEANWEKATKELAELSKAGMTDAEKAIEEAKAQGRREALEALAPQRVQDKLDAAAAKAGVDLTPVKEHLDVTKFLADGDVNADAIGEFVAQFSAQLGGQKGPKFAQGLGIGPQSDSRNPGQLTRSDLQGMTHREVAQARKDGRLEALMRGEI